MPHERLLGEVLAERHWTPVMLALAADIDTRTAHRIIAGESRPRGTTAIRMAESLGIGYDRMRRILAATRDAGHAAHSGLGSPVGVAGPESGCGGA